MALYSLPQDTDRYLAIGRRQLPLMAYSAGDELPRAEILGRPLAAAKAFGCPQFRLNGRRNMGRDLVLNRENVGQHAIVLLSPDMAARSRLNELGGDAHALPALAYTSFQDVAGAKVASHLLHVDALTLVDERGAARDDEEPGKSRKRSNDVFSDAVAEILLLRIAGSVGERQDRNRRLIEERTRFSEGCGLARSRLSRGLHRHCRAFADLGDKAQPPAGDGADQPLLD